MTEVEKQNIRSLTELTAIDPSRVLAERSEAAKALVAFIAKSQQKVVTTFKGKQFLHFPAWQTIGSFFGVVPVIEWTKRYPEDRSKPLQAWEAAARLVHIASGKTVGYAESSCRRDEEVYSRERGKWIAAWERKPESQLESAAQTRACAKALRLAFESIPVLAGYEPVPYEEVELTGGYGGEETERPATQGRPRVIPAVYTCKNCGRELRVMYGRFGPWVRCDDCKWKKSLTPEEVKAIEKTREQGAEDAGGGGADKSSPDGAEGADAM